MYYLLDLERTVSTGVVFYWNPNKRGYTHIIEDAGKYTENEAIEIVEGDFDMRTIMIPETTVEKILEK
jgi:predicted nucleotidyltransferase